jgi:multicomponent Na+:H+ antiporter subunit D
MSIPLPVFVAVPLVTAFLLPIFGKRGKRIATLLANLATASLLGLAIAVIGKSGVYEIGNWSIPLGINLVLDGLSSLMLLVISTVGTAAMLFSARYMEQYTAKAKYLSLFLLMITGMNGVLVGFGCEAEELEASFKYMVLGSIASIFILFAVGLIYGNTGSLNMAYISKAIQVSGLNLGLAFALSLFIAGFSLKAALVPFHAWLPDAHPSAPAPISAMLLGLTSMVAGAFLAIGQWDFKRLLAYSSISQVGYVVLGIGLGGLILAKGGNPTWASLALLGGLFHLANHSISKSLLFLTSGSVEMSTGTRDMKKMGGLAAKLPFTRATCTVASASVAGVPPFSGFWSKLILVIAAVQAHFIWVAVVIVFVSLCTLIMYLKVQRHVFLGELPDTLKQIREHRGAMVVAMVSLACLCILMCLLVIIPSLRSSILDPAVKALVDGLGYSTKVIGTQ